MGWVMRVHETDKRSFNSVAPKQLTFLLMSTAVASLMMAGVARSQDAGNIQLNTIVIDGDSNPVGPDKGYIAKNTLTGSKTDVPIREIPQSISVVTREQMDDRIVDRVEDAIAYTSGVTASPWGVDERFDQFLIRGFDVGTYAVFRDGLPQKAIDFSGFKSEPYGMERVEVLKGPSSVLYGENDVAGLVNLVTKRPTTDPFYSAYAGYGSFNTYELGIDAGGPLDKEGVWTYRLTGLLRDGELETDFSQNDRVYIAPAITWSPSADTSLTVLANYQWDKLTPNAFLPVANPAFPDLPKFSRSFTTAQPGFNDFDANHGSIGYLFEHSFNDAWKVQQNLRYSSQDTDYRHLYYSSMADDTTMNRTLFTVDETATIFSVDNNVQYDYENARIKNTLLMGLDYTRQTVDGHNGYGEGPTLDITDPDYHLDIEAPAIYVDRKQTVDQIGLYGQTQTKFDDHWLLTLGGRQSWVTNKNFDRLSDTSDTQDDNAFTGKAGLGYLFDNGFTPYISYTESFSPVIGQGSSGQTFAPSEGKQYEAGVKYEPDYFPGTVTGSVFEITKSNVLTPDPVDPTFQVQTGEVRHRGFELESVVNLFHGVSLIASYTYLDAEITSSNIDGEVGNRPALVPEHQAGLWAKYTFETGALEGLNVGSGVRYVGSTYGDNANLIKVDNYTLVDALISYEKNGWKGSLKASNIFDKEYYSTCSSDDIGNPMCIYGEGRAIKATLSAKF
ncbi:iron complex outermembrane recepter protein [Phyllobacterium sp. YR620]|nr:iron complex outermembrane recepter protein [Phyllobacterium sp. YR620]